MSLIISSFNQITPEQQSGTLLELIPKEIYPLIDSYTSEIKTKQVAIELLKDFLSLEERVIKPYKGKIKYIPDFLKEKINDLINDPSTTAAYLKEVCTSLAAIHSSNIFTPANERLECYKKITNIFEEKNPMAVFEETDPIKKTFFFNSENFGETGYLLDYENLERIFSSGNNYRKDFEKTQ